MIPFTRLEGLVLPLDRANVDTDQIVPARFLTAVSRIGYGRVLFNEWRYLKAPGGVEGAPNPDFVLNQPRYRGSTIMLARENFGCGSSREHAVWALQEEGFRAIVAPSFGDILYGNSLRNGLLPIVLAPAEIDRLFGLAETEPLRLAIDLAAQTVAVPETGERFGFDIDPFRKDCLLKGLDDVALTLREDEAIRDFEASHARLYPWLAADLR